MSVRDRSTLWMGVRTGLSITVVAVLIWLFAEAQSLSERVLEVRVTVLAPSGADLVVNTEDEDWSGRISLRVQGARAVLDNAARDLADGVVLLVGSPGISGNPGRQLVDLRTALMNNPPLDRADVTVVSTEPRTLELRIDELVRVEGVDIAPELPGVRTTGDIAIEPDTATLIMPSRRRDALGPALANLTIRARLSASTIEGLPEGGPQRHEARLSPPAPLAGEPSIRIEPSTAALTFTVRSTTDSVVLQSVPVWPMIPPTDVNRWDVAIEPMLIREVRFSGPSDLIERIRSKELRVVATVVLDSDELESRIESKTPEFLRLPEDISVDSEIEPVRLRITPRSAQNGDGTSNE